MTPEFGGTDGSAVELDSADHTDAFVKTKYWI
jgi:hypothetical protein